MGHTTLEPGAVSTVVMDALNMPIARLPIPAIRIDTMPIAPAPVQREEKSYTRRSQANAVCLCGINPDRSKATELYLPLWPYLP